jgi:hypothetical protein
MKGKWSFQPQWWTVHFSTEFFQFSPMNFDALRLGPYISMITMAFYPFISLSLSLSLALTLSSILVILGFESWASCFLRRCSIHWPILQMFFKNLFFW